MKKILIIGATSAIAQEVAKHYAQQSSEIYLLGRNSQQLEIIQQDLKVRGASQVHFVACDLNQFADHPTLVDNAFKTLQKIDVALMAHGILGNQENAEKNQTELMNIINTNFVSHASLMNLIADRMKMQKEGTIAVISSVAGDRGKYSNYIYGSTFAAKSAFADGLRNRLFESGVNVVTLKLGFVDTPMTKSFKKGSLWAKPDQVARGIVRAIENKSGIVYLPFFWRFIMLIIKSIPDFVFKQLKL